MNVAHINKIVEKFDSNKNLLISILQEIQAKYGYLPEESLKIVSKRINKPLSEIYGVATFYKSFRLVHREKHLITVCVGTACHVRGGEKIVDALSRFLNIQVGETTKDRNFSLETVNCLGCCAIGPVMVVDGEYYGEMNIQKALNLINKIRMGEKHEKVKQA